uniref:Uncharacterized protein n=1 Tax=Meloidogyne incognita TaxID=6306 RepID=A0A914MVG4_MELIC
MAMLAPLSPCPVVGIHVRRTDKYREAKLQKLEDYLLSRIGHDQGWTHNIQF